MQPNQLSKLKENIYSM